MAAAVRSHLLWVLVALLGAFALSLVAVERGEHVNALWIVVAAIAVYLIAYRYYSLFIANRVMQLDPERATPAVRHNDGLDYVPTNKYVLFGHHFAAIAGAGPLVGPVLAAQMGYLPSTLWILAGVVFAGAVQDFIVLFVSTRRDGRSLGDLIRLEMGPVAGVIALIGVLAIMIILLAVLALVVVKALAASPWAPTLAVLWVAQMVAELAFSFALPFIPLYIQELGVEDAAQAGLWAGAMAGGFAVVMAVMGPVWGQVADRHGRRLMIQRALFGAAVVVGAMALVQTPEQLFVLRLLQGSVTGVVAAFAIQVFRKVRESRTAVAFAVTLCVLITIQFTLGVLSVYTGLVMDITALHVAFGAVTMVTATMSTAAIARQYGTGNQAVVPEGVVAHKTQAWVTA